MATSGQTLNDRINAARYALAGQGLARCVCKATTEEVIGPKKKHLDYLLACTHEPNVSIPQLANLLIERTNHIYWVVVFKALVTVHHLMSYGNERFTQYLASSNYSFELSTFLDKTAARDFSMSTFIRRYSRYINEKALSYRLLAFDFCKVKRGNEGVLRLMPIDRLLKTLPVLQCQLDALLEFDCSANDLNNGVINASFMLLFRDLIGLFACHNDGIINLLNKYFNLNRKMTREALDLYKKFLVRMDKVSDFLRVAEVVGIDKDEIPDLRRAPSSLIDALEQHLQNMESNKKILKQPNVGGGGGGSSSNNKSGEFSALGNLTPPSSKRPNSPASASNPPSSNQNDDFALNTFKDEEVRKALEEEARMLSQYGTDGMKSKPTSKSGTSAVTGVVTSTNNNSPEFAFATIPKSVDDIFGDADSFGPSNLDSNGSALDNLSSASSSSSTANKQRPDLDSIKSAIKSATTTLEKSNNSLIKGISEQRQNNNNNNNNKKASDDLFSLLDTSSTTVVATPTTVPLANANNAMTLIGPPPSAQTGRSIHRNAPLDGDNPISPFASPFDLPTTNISNGQMPTLKPGNPFPDAADDFTTGSPSAFPMALKATLANPSQPTPASSVFRTGASTANYTNLGGLEGFGDLLQPMNSSSKGTGSNVASFGATKSSFSAQGLSSTGLFKGDLDTTLANLAQNLTFDGISKTKK